MDLFQVIREFNSVKQVSNLYPEVENKPLNFLFFICPATKPSGYKINRNKTGLTVEYVNGYNKSTDERLTRVNMFIEEAKKAKISFNVSAIFASADAIMLFPIPVTPPFLPDLDFGIKIVSNYEIVWSNFARYAKLFYSKPWENVPDKFVRMEYDRIKTFFSERKIPQYIVQDFIERVFAGFALDGVLIRGGYFGDNPVILGIESPGVVVLQNAALPRKQWLPIIQLC